MDYDFYYVTFFLYYYFVKGIYIINEILYFVNGFIWIIYIWIMEKELILFGY